MKAIWTRLSSMVLKQGGDTRFMEPRFENLFMRHHKNADELVLDKDGNPLAAVYFTPRGWRPGDLRALMQAIRERTEP
jgi:hypothetical protein